MDLRDVDFGRSLLFGGFSDDELALLIDTAAPRERVLSRGALLFVENEAIDHFWFVHSGQFATARLGVGGEENYIHMHIPGYTIGLVAVNTEQRTLPYRCICLADAVVYEFDPDIFTNERIPVHIRTRLIFNLVRQLANDNVRANKKIDILYHKSLRARICAFLVMREQMTKSPDFEISMTREELAAYLGVNRSRLSNELSKMRDEGIIFVHKGHFKILNRDAIRSLN
jgi:CRP-like cAMP-binding protein